MSILVLADHHDGQLAGENVAAAAARLDGISRVGVADHAAYTHQLAEPLSALLVELAGDYTHLLAAASTTGKNVMPRVVAFKDVSQLSEISAVDSADTFARPIYASNAIATVQSGDALKVITVRSTGFDAVAVSSQDQGSATIETVDTVVDNAQSSFVEETLAQSDRTELGAAPELWPLRATSSTSPR